MVREYVGARYVPKFMGTYDATQVYEALCVVDNGLGTSYISKIPTPAGTPLTDTTYWAVYGATSGAIINLQNQIDDMKDNTIPGSLQNQISANATQITAIDPYEKFRNKTICVIGDSISDEGVLADNWVNRLRTFMSDYNCTIINESANGRSFASLKEDIDNSVVTIPAADYYVLFIGTNYDDSWGYTAGTYPLYPAIAAVHSAIIAANPQAKYFFLSPLKKWIHLNQELNDISFMRAYLEKEFAYRGYTVLSGYNIGELSSSTKTYYMMDDIHPNANFSDILFRYVLDGMVSERSNVIVGCKKTRAIIDTLGSNSVISFDYDANLKVSISITAYGWTPTINTWIDLCDMPTLLEANTTPIFQASGQNANVPQYRVQNGKLQVYFFSAPSPSVFYDYLLYSMSFATGD